MEEHHEHKTHVEHAHIEPKEDSGQAKDHSHKRHSNPDYKLILGISTVVLVIALIVSILTHGFSGIDKKTVPEDELKEKVNNYVNQLLQGQATANVNSIKDIGDLYQIKMNIDGRAYDSYATKDGSLLFVNAIDMTKDVNAPEEQQETIKTDKPEVQMFVMSECPYGVMAEDAFIPLAKLLKDKIDFKIYFIASDNGDGTFSSLHGQEEVDENLRQICAMEYYPDTYLDYVDCQNKNYLAREDMATTWNGCLKQVNFDEAKIKECVDGEEGKELLRENIKLSDEKGVSGSPTIFINGVKYNGARITQAFQSSVCAAFKKVPPECSTVMNVTSTAAAPAGGCGE